MTSATVNYQALAERVMEQCATLARCSSTPGSLVRTYLSAPMREAQEILRGWMETVGLSVTLDDAGNLLGRLEGRSEATFLTGSHLDTVIGAGSYDGPLGVLMSLAVAGLFENQELPFSLEVVAFSEEEGVRFGTPFLGSLPLAGGFDPALLDRRDSDGISMREAIRNYGLNPNRIGELQRPFIGFLEAHIEQGPVLDDAEEPLAVVSGIVGQRRLQVQYLGRAGHAGTVPMGARADALAAAAELVLRVERLGTERPGLVSTVGKLVVEPNATNVIPGSVTLSIDFRHIDGTVLEEMEQSFRREAEQIAGARGLAVRLSLIGAQATIPCDPKLTTILAEACGQSVRHLASGAGHDAMVMARCCPVTMLFLRCHKGISHHPEESVRPDVVAAGLEAMHRFFLRLHEE